MSANTEADVIPLRRRDAVTRATGPVGKPRKNLGNRNHPTEYLPHLTQARRAAYWALVDRRGPDECWPWKGAKSGKRGRFKLDGHSRPSHCVGYVIEHNQEIPAGFDVDHDPCNDPGCQNPAHLVLATRAENLARRSTTSVAAPPDDESCRARATAHRTGQPIEPLGVDAGVKYLDWVFRAALEKRWDCPSAPIPDDARSADIKALGMLLAHGERTATLTIVDMVENWNRNPGTPGTVVTGPVFREFAAEAYGLWGGWVDRAPTRPVPLRGRDMVTAALAFHRHLDNLRERAAREEQEEREHARAEHERRVHAQARKRLERARELFAAAYPDESGQIAIEMLRGDPGSECRRAEADRRGLELLDADEREKQRAREREQQEQQEQQERERRENEQVKEQDEEEYRQRYARVLAHLRSVVDAYVREPSEPRAREVHEQMRRHEGEFVFEKVVEEWWARAESGTEEDRAAAHIVRELIATLSGWGYPCPSSIMSWEECRGEPTHR